MASDCAPGKIKVSDSASGVINASDASGPINASDGASGAITASDGASGESTGRAAAEDGDNAVVCPPQSPAEAKVDVLSHAEIMHVVKDTVAALITNDPLLKDLHPYVTLEEVNSVIALEYGQAMVVQVMRADGDVMPVVVKQEASVLDLKNGIKRFMTLQLSRNNEGPTTINWRYIWRHHWLYFQAEKLMDDNKLLKDYGIRNRDEVTFMKRLRDKMM